MTDKDRFDLAMRSVLSVSKEEMLRRLAEDNARQKVGKKRGPKPSASPVPAGAGSR